MRGRQRDDGTGRVWGLCRVSSQRQDREGTSLEGQQQAIARWTTAQGLTAATFVIEVESGSAEKVERREGLQRILREAQRGDVVAVYAVDRWSRDLVYTMQSVRALTARGARWYAIREALDATTREGDDRLGLMAWIAENERKRIRERTNGRKIELREAGYYVNGMAPTGYVVRDRKLIPGPDAPIVQEAVRRCLTESLQSIATTLPTPRGRKKWDKRAVLAVIRSRYYLGESPREDGTWHSTHEPLVDRDTWERAQAALRSRAAGGRIPGDGWSAERLLRGLATCALCGSRISIALGRLRQGDPGRCMSYACAGYLSGRCRARHIHAERLDALADHAALERLKELRHELARQEPAPAAPAARKPDHGTKLAAAHRKRARLIEAYADGTLTKEDVRERLDAIDAEIGKLSTAEAAARRRREAAEALATPEVRVGLLGQVEALTRAWQRAPVDVRRAILGRLAERIEVTPAPRARTHDVVAPRIRWKPIEALAAER